MESFEALRDGYARLWEKMTVTRVSEANHSAKRVIEPEAKGRYLAVQTKTAVPWFVVGCLHLRESDGNFHAWLHNGDPMRDHRGRPCRTVHVPAGRPPDPACDWEAGAVDALTMEHLQGIADWGPERVAYAAEKFNGFGYRAHSIPSPYLWGGTDVQQRGKYVKDGVFDRHAWDGQLGCMAVLKQIMALDPSATFKKEQ